MGAIIAEGINARLALLLVVGGLCAASVACHRGRRRPNETVVTYASFDGEYTARASSLDCDPATPGVRTVTLSEKRWFGWTRPSDVFVAMGSGPVSLEWVGYRRLRVRADKPKVILALEIWLDVQIEYEFP